MPITLALTDQSIEHLKLSQSYGPSVDRSLFDATVTWCAKRIKEAVFYPDHPLLCGLRTHPPEPVYGALYCRSLFGGSEPPIRTPAKLEMHDELTDYPVLFLHVLVYKLTRSSSPLHAELRQFEEEAQNCASNKTAHEAAVRQRGRVWNEIELSAHTASREILSRCELCNTYVHDRRSTYFHTQGNAAAAFAEMSESWTKAKLTTLHICERVYGMLENVIGSVQLAEPLQAQLYDHAAILLQKFFSGFNSDQPSAHWASKQIDYALRLHHKLKELSAVELFRPLIDPYDRKAVVDEINRLHVLTDSITARAGEAAPLIFPPGSYK